MIRLLQKIINWVIVLGWLWVLSVAAIQSATPAEAYLDVISVTVDDAPVGQVPKMHVDRVIKQNFVGRWVAEVEIISSQSAFIYQCGSFGEATYNIENKLPEPLTLDFWTWPIKCTPTVPGSYRVETTWTIQLPGGLEKYVHKVSNIFTIYNPTDRINS